jgi:hypothetical protein
MARAQFHKNQRVYVRPVGTWALIERVVPQWSKGLEEPLRIFYDLGLGRKFSADELEGEASPPQAGEDEEQWRIVRAPNKWQPPTETTNHPVPGTRPIIVTGEVEWGGWRVPGAEYALSPERVEKQARIIASTPMLASLVKRIAEWSRSESVPASLLGLVGECKEMVRYLDSGTD